MTSQSLVGALLLALVSSPVRAQVAAGVDGTYRLAVCKTACTPGDTTMALAWGQLILSDTVFRLEQLPDSVQRGLRVRFLRRPANACWVLQTAPGNRTSFAGIGGLGVTRWDYQGAGTPEMTFDLYRSPDAGHRVTATVTNGMLHGVGRSAGAGVMEVDWPTDTVIGHRQGPSDFAPCYAAALVRWAAIRGRRP